MSRSEIIKDLNLRLKEKYEPTIKKMIRLEGFKNIEHYRYEIMVTLAELDELSGRVDYLEDGHTCSNGFKLEWFTVTQINITHMIKKKDKSFFKVCFTLSEKDT